MDVALVFSPALGAYDFGPDHPLRPGRVLRTISLVEAYGLIAEDGPLQVLDPTPASREDLLRVHDPGYVDDVARISLQRRPWAPRRGIGTGDTPGFSGMHQAASLVAGATSAAMAAVTGGRFTRAFSPAGGLHHAHRDRAAGFCVYNDPAVAIAAALHRDPDLKVLYLDIDAHHGDGVQEAFYEEPRVLTISLHEDGRYLYPGTGSVRERGAGAGEGYAINVPLPPYALPRCYLLAFDEVVAPAARAFAPHVIFAQCGADAHWSDPLTSLAMTLAGFETLYGRITGLADELCAGRLVASGGGGYAWRHVVPRAWTLLASALAGVGLPDKLPDPPRAWWRSDADPSDSESDLPDRLREDETQGLSTRDDEDLLGDTRRVIEQLRGLGVPLW